MMWEGRPNKEMIRTSGCCTFRQKINRKIKESGGLGSEGNPNAKVRWEFEDIYAGTKGRKKEMLVLRGRKLVVV